MCLEVKKEDIRTARLVSGAQSDEKNEFKVFSRKAIW